MTATRSSYTYFRSTLMGVEIHPSARRHGISDIDMTHAYTHAITWIELGDDPPRYLTAGPNRAGNLLELVVLDTGQHALLIHAMKLRRTTAQELFKGPTL